jgi:hypothetical protein
MEKKMNPNRKFVFFVDIAFTRRAETKVTISQSKFLELSVLPPAVTKGCPPIKSQHGDSMLTFIKMNSRRRTPEYL